MPPATSATARTSTRNSFIVIAPICPVRDRGRQWRTVSRGKVKGWLMAEYSRHSGRLFGDNHASRRVVCAAIAKHCRSVRRPRARPRPCREIRSAPPAPSRRRRERRPSLSLQLGDPGHAVERPPAAAALRSCRISERQQAAEQRGVDEIEQRLLGREPQRRDRGELGVAAADPAEREEDEGRPRRRSPRPPRSSRAPAS